MAISKERKDEIIEQYAQRVVEDMDIDDLMEAVKDNIIAAKDDLPEVEALDNILESEYAGGIFTNEEIVELTQL